MKRIVNNLTSSIPYIFVFIASLYRPTDPDLGWHLKYGEYFFKHGYMLRENILSSQMSGYSWANGSWGFDLLLYVLFSFGGFLSLTLSAALLVTLTCYFFSKALKLSLLEQAFIFPLIIVSQEMLNINALKGQQVSLFFLSVLFFLVQKYLFTSETASSLSRKLYFIPLLFLVWCNVQVESFLGLALLGVWFVLHLIRIVIQKKPARKEARTLTFIFVGSLIASFITPFGYGVHHIVITHLTDPLLLRIDEYIPFTQFSHGWWNQLIAYILFWIISVYLFRKKALMNNLPLWGSCLLLLTAAFFVKRFSWPGYYLLIPLLVIIFHSLRERVLIYRKEISITFIVLLVIIVGYKRMPFQQFSSMSWTTFCSIQRVPCSSAAAEYVEKHTYTKNLFTYYDWGGWLIWNYPNIKPSVDGRMHMWRDAKGRSAFADYDNYMVGVKKIDTSPFDVVLIPMDRNIPIYWELSQLIAAGKWDLVYEDRTAGVFVRRKKLPDFVIPEGFH